MLGDVCNGAELAVLGACVGVVGQLVVVHSVLAGSQRLCCPGKRFLLLCRSRAVQISGCSCIAASV